jgi:sulfhydrogenase subunit gamma (sulfur reductase)
MNNPYDPYPVKIREIKTETVDRSLKTFTFEFIHKADEAAFSYRSGQFAMLSVPGWGKFPSASLPPRRKKGSSSSRYSKPAR